ncbi:adenylate/guanylate cyclase domain-containing protein [Mycolicibacterium moriokaense]|uniref:Class 3 adenylate cyclase n=1 Tax=Mycolicibacterium moriokaense TaxID=39691 RepID=A0A318HQQ1_9MYCO|nr:adenylate/guanylate cyclase domain-containing protein [Mycolicibacterium moriokaense]PXX11169.1 class 3 adenylate cyclase [Mycolicibacterium moriokaense]
MLQSSDDDTAVTDSSAADQADAEASDERGPGSGRFRRLRRRRLLSRFSIQSKLVLMMVLCTIIGSAVVGSIAYQAGRSTLRTQVFNRLTEVRESQSRALASEFKDLKNSLVIYSHGAITVPALQAFNAGFDQLSNATIDPAQQQSISDYYNNTFMKEIQHYSAVKPDLGAVLPATNAEKYLQANYTAQRKSDDVAVTVDDAHDGSAWSAANVRYQDFFRQIVQRFEFQDVLLLDTRGNVVYTAYKDVDLGTNILTGPYNTSLLRGAYEKALASNSDDYVGITDFEIYQPAEGQPTAWMVSPISDNGRTDGVMALQFPITKIDRLMTFDKQWAASGMGETGETFLAGPDDLMRSDSRMLLQDPDRYRHDVVQAGTPPDVADTAIRMGMTTLIQPIGSDATRAAQRGESGTTITHDYLGQETLQAYAPVVIPDSGLHWSIVAKLDTAEAFARESKFTRTMVIAVTGTIFAICLAAMVASQVFVRPIRRLEAGARRISGGEYDVSLPVEARDEIGDLTLAFNEMSRNLAIKEDLLNEQRRENDRLLSLLMPEQVVERYRQGEEIIAQDHHDVSVIFADIVGLDRLQAELSSEESLSIINELARQMDAAADELGVEPVRTVHNGYLASCGLNVPRLDNVRRTVDFAVEAQRIIDRFNAETGRHLGLRAGIDTGQVSSGLVGRSSIVYDMWGAAVNLAYRVQSGSPQDGIYVTQQVYETIGDTRVFTSAGSITIDGVEQPIWRLSERSA